MGAPTGPVTDAAVGSAAVQEERYHWGMAGTWKVSSAALQGDETASLLAGNELELDESFGRLFIDLPIVTGPKSRLFLRFQGTLRFFHGHIDGLTVGGLKKLSPGLAGLIMQTAKDFEDLPGAEEVTDRGTDLTNHTLAKEVKIDDTGFEPGLVLFAGGPSWHVGGDVYVEAATFGIGAFFHISRMTVTLTKEKRWKKEHFLGVGGGITVNAAFFTFYDKASGFRFQPAAIEANAFGLISDNRLRALVAEVAVLAEIAWGF